MLPFTCRPDKYISETDLTAIFDEFNNSMNAGQSWAATFSSVVNNVRHFYMSALVETREELLSQYKDQAHGFAALELERQDERGSQVEYFSSLPGTQATSVSSVAQTLDTSVYSMPGTRAPSVSSALVALPPISDVAAGTMFHERNQEPDGEITWPAITFSLHVGSLFQDYRRDMVDWQNMNRDGWTERLMFNVFKFEEPATIKIYVVESSSPPYRIMVNREPWAFQGWKKRLEFHAYARPRPGTQPVWVGYQDDPQRCIFVKGEQGDTMPGWERRLEFWVPK